MRNEARFKIMFGNAIEVAARFGLPKSYFRLKGKGDNTEAVDFPRVAFVDCRGRTRAQFIDAWSKSAVPGNYAQGDMDASFYTSKLFFDFVYFSDRFVVAVAPDASLDEPQTQAMREGFLCAKQDFRFAFFNAEGILCGFSLTYSTVQPSLWVAAVVRFTPASPERREVTFASHAAFLIPEEGTGVPANQILSELLQAVQDPKINHILAGIISTKGDVNIQALEALKRYIGPGKSFDGRTNLLTRNPWCIVGVGLGLIALMASFWLVSSVVALGSVSIVSSELIELGLGLLLISAFQITVNEWYASWTKGSHPVNEGSFRVPSCVDTDTLVDQSGAHVYGEIWEALKATLEPAPTPPAPGLTHAHAAAHPAFSIPSSADDVRNRSRWFSPSSPTSPQRHPFCPESTVTEQETMPMP